MNDLKGSSPNMRFFKNKVETRPHSKKRDNIQKNWGN
jgi:hypothetical protein